MRGVCASKVGEFEGLSWVMASVFCCDLKLFVPLFAEEVEGFRDACQFTTVLYVTFWRRVLRVAKGEPLYACKATFVWSFLPASSTSVGRHVWDDGSVKIHDVILETQNYDCESFL